MSRWFQPRLLRALLLTAFLLAAQLLLLQHQADLAQHATGENCEWCLAHAPLAGGLPSASLVVNLPATQPFVPALSVTVAPTGILLPAYASRAPPAVLSL